MLIQAQNRATAFLAACILANALRYEAMHKILETHSSKDNIYRSDS